MYLGTMIRSGGSLSRSVELAVQWDRILALGPVTLDDLSINRDLGIGAFFHAASGVHRRLSDFHAVVLHRRDEAIRGWRNWIREDPVVRPYKWLRPDLVPRAPFLQCDAHLTPGGSGVLADPSARVDEEFRKAWLPYFCRSGQRETSLDEFSFEVDGWLPLLPEVHLPGLTGQMLADVVLRKGVSAGSLDGWGWRELKALPVSWFDELARILTKVGVWPDGLLDAYIAMIPKTDGDATPLGQRPLSVLPIVHRIWASARMGQLDGWFKSWVPDAVFSAGVFVDQLRHGKLLLLILRRFLLELLIPMFIFLLLMLLSLLTLLIGGNAC